MKHIFVSLLLFVTTLKSSAEELPAPNLLPNSVQQAPPILEKSQSQTDENSANLPAKPADDKGKFYESETEKKRHSRDSGTTATTEVNTQTKIRSKYTNPQGSNYEVDPD